jgi:hypothetical protein
MRTRTRSMNMTIYNKPSNTLNNERHTIKVKRDNAKALRSDGHLTAVCKRVRHDQHQRTENV